MRVALWITFILLNAPCFALELHLIREINLNDSQVSNRGFAGNDALFYVTDRSSNGFGPYGNITLTVYDATNGAIYLDHKNLHQAPQLIDSALGVGKILVGFAALRRPEELESLALLDFRTNSADVFHQIANGTSQISFDQDAQAALIKNPLHEEETLIDLRTKGKTVLSFNPDIEVFALASGRLIKIKKTSEKDVFDVFEPSTNEKLGSFVYETTPIGSRNIEYALLHNRYLLGFEAHSQILRFFVDLSTGKPLISTKETFIAARVRSSSRYLVLFNEVTQQLNIFDSETQSFSVPEINREEIVSLGVKDETGEVFYTTRSNFLVILRKEGSDWRIRDEAYVDCDKFSMISPNIGYVYCPGTNTTKWWNIR